MFKLIIFLTLFLTFISFTYSSTCSYNGNSCLSGGVCSTNCKQLGRKSGVCNWNSKENKCICYCYQRENVEIKNNLTFGLVDYDIINNKIKNIFKKCPQCKNNIQSTSCYGCMNMNKEECLVLFDDELFCIKREKAKKTILGCDGEASSIACFVCGSQYFKPCGGQSKSYCGVCDNNTCQSCGTAAICCSPGQEVICTCNTKNGLAKCFCK